MEKGAAVDILLVEDNPTDAELVMRALKAHDLTDSVEQVKDGEAALDFLFRRGDYAARINSVPRVVFLDLRLPKVDGLEVLKQMRADEHTRLIPVVVMTSSGEERDIVASYQLGANSFISKPVAFEEFVKTVGDLGSYWMQVNKVASAGGAAG
ncbi:MAG: two-component system response regulator [Gallionellales bacterium RIFCSPLOWO2_12_FULL_59_22]|nr:MAG: two-component system response regulator [Gallionellales bacterium RIFCSPLOWO2_02_FULL_59_110]OGT05503.1 MAG: two-component system response regulator [Gallionellales bacterium RIFCSPLOWO2_02_58_13]OGT13903.1 MAG: two-component system response regulator [Gallionellales bacterium RIFCSPLOWO2_12_FULL_59_22]